MRTTAFATALSLALALAGCAGSSGVSETSPASSSQTSQESASPEAEQQVATPQPEARGAEQASSEANENDKDVVEMRMSIGGTEVNVEWEHNQAVSDLQALVAEGPVTVELYMYGGFEQVGTLGASLTTSDVQMTTEPGDIVLYAGNQISVFYGPNSWSYTKLGHITDRSADEMAEMLGNGDTSITITVQ